jgi:hypothetical protein
MFGTEKGEDWGKPGEKENVSSFCLFFFSMPRFI